MLTKLTALPPPPYVGGYFVTSRAKPTKLFLRQQPFDIGDIFRHGHFGVWPGAFLRSWGFGCRPNESRG